ERQKIPPVNIVIAHRQQTGEAEVAKRARRRRDTRSSPLLDGCDSGRNVAPEIAHPDTCAIAVHGIDRASTGPLIEQIREVNARLDWMFEPGSQTRINLHQVRR